MPKFQIFEGLRLPGASTGCAPKSVSSGDIQAAGNYRLEYLSVFSGTNDVPTATVKVAIDGQTKPAISDGKSGIDAIFKAIGQTLDIVPEVAFWSCPTVFKHWGDAAEFHVGLRFGDMKVTGCAYATDIYVAAAQAYIDCLNQYSASTEDEDIHRADKQQGWDQLDQICFSEWRPRG